MYKKGSDVLYKRSVEFWLWRIQTISAAIIFLAGSLSTLIWAHAMYAPGDKKYIVTHLLLPALPGLIEFLVIAIGSIKRFWPILILNIYTILYTVSALRAAYLYNDPKVSMGVLDLLTNIQNIFSVVLNVVGVWLAVLLVNKARNRYSRK